MMASSATSNQPLCEELRALGWFSLYVASKHGFIMTITWIAMQATSKNGKADGVELVEPPLESKPGERVYFEGAEFESKSA
jgi:hypothetical protein